MAAFLASAKLLCELDAATKVGGFVAGQIVRDEPERVLRDLLLSEAWKVAQLAAKTLTKDQPQAELQDLSAEVSNSSHKGVLDVSQKVANDVWACVEAVEFSNGESFGENLDLRAVFTEFDGYPELSYVEFLKKLLSNTLKSPRKVNSKKAASDYAVFLSKICSYLEVFYAKTRPLEDLKLSDLKMNEEKCLAMSMSELKEALLARGLKCGGSKAQRAARLLSSEEPSPLQKIYAFFEVEHNKTLLKRTIERAERGTTRGTAEIETERETKRSALQTWLKQSLVAFTTGVVVSEVDPEDDDAGIVDTKATRVYLDETGTPIPFWMYKLQGLGREFKCEICGDASYKGPRAFEAHFGDRRHLAGLKRVLNDDSNLDLDVYRGITDVAEAAALEETLRAKRQKQCVEEREDAEGNVL